MTCNKCNRECNTTVCGCDAPLTSPAPCPTPAPCVTAQPCSTITDTDCVVYTGDPISYGSTIIVNTNDTVSEALTNIVETIPVPTSNIFRGLLTQSGTSAPTLVTQENSLGVTFTLARSATGTYTLSTTSPIFISNNLWYNIAPGQNINQAFRINLPSTTSITIYSYNLVAGSYVLSDSKLFNTPIEIIIYA